MNLISWALLALIVAAVLLAVKTARGGSCGCGASGCSGDCGGCKKDCRSAKKKTNGKKGT